MKMLVEVNNLKKYFINPSQDVVQAVDGVSFSIDKGETLGLVGESGCGKTTIGRCILRLIECTDGEVLFEGKNIKQLNNYKLRLLRKKMQIIFQDPFSSLDPRKTVFELVSEPLLIHRLGDRKAIKDKALEVLKSVGLEKENIFSKYPHELDGGRCQRVGIARALCIGPKFIVCDEPISSLDVSLQAQILNLLMDLQERLSLTYLFISHDISVVKHISNYVVVMYLGKIMECAKKDELFNHHLHPYTNALFEAVPSPLLKDKRERTILIGDVPTPINPGPGCRFAGRCPISNEKCRMSQPPLVDIGNKHKVACFRI